MKKCFCRQIHFCEQSAESQFTHPLAAVGAQNTGPNFWLPKPLLMACLQEVGVTFLITWWGCVSVQSIRSRSWQMLVHGRDVAAVADHRDELGMRLWLGIVPLRTNPLRFMALWNDTCFSAADWCTAAVPLHGSQCQVLLVNRFQPTYKDLHSRHAGSLSGSSRALWS